MAYSPITLWQIDEETMTDFIFLDSKIAADDDRSHEIKRYLGQTHRQQFSRLRS